jgi:hypothetical protein
MAVKKATTVKKAPVKTSVKAKAVTAKKAPAKASAPATKKRVSKGSSMVCEVCGLAVVVEQIGDLVVSQESVLLCCDEPMKQKAGKAKATTKK